MRRSADRINWRRLVQFSYLACCITQPCTGITYTNRTVHVQTLPIHAATVSALSSARQMEMRVTSVLDALVLDVAKQVITSQDWGVLGIALALCFLADGFILQRLPQSFRWDLFRIVFWVIAAGVYCFTVACLQGKKHAVQWIGGYALEWLLSLDNAFLFLLVFKTYKTPEKLMPKALSCWIPFGILLRLAMFATLEGVYDRLAWVTVVAGIYVVYSAIVAAVWEDDDMDVSELSIVKLCHYCFGASLEDKYDEEGHSLFIWSDGGIKATLLVMVVVSLVVVDFLLAFDSVSAKVTQIPDTYLSCSSTMMALFGMRAFVGFLDDLVNIFDMLKYGICGILVFVGVQLIFSGLAPSVFNPSPTTSMIVIVSFLVCSIVTSLMRICICPAAEPNEGVEEPGLSS